MKLYQAIPPSFIEITAQDVDLVISASIVLFALHCLIILVMLFFIIYKCDRASNILYLWDPSFTWKIKLGVRVENKKNNWIMHIYKTRNCSKIGLLLFPLCISVLFLAERHIHAILSPFRVSSVIF